jgi:hypothetical protein
MESSSCREQCDRQNLLHFGWLRRRLKSELRYRWGVDMKPRRGSAKLVRLRLVRRLASLSWLMLPVLSAVARAPWFDRGFQAALQSASAGAPARVRWCVAGGVFAPRVARGGRRVRAHLRRHPRQRLRRPDSGCNCRIGDQSADQAFPISGRASDLASGPWRAASARAGGTCRSRRSTSAGRRGGSPTRSVESS